MTDDADPLGSLVSNPRNPRSPWKPDQIEPFKASLRRFGDLGGIVLNLTTGRLVGGHKRVEVFRQSPDVQIKKTKQPEDDQGTVAHGYVQVDGSRFAYREVRWSEAIEAAANLAANRWNAEWEWQLVAETLKEIADPDLLVLTGFPAHELENLVAADWSPVAREPLVEDDPDHTHTVKLTAAQYDALQRSKNQLVRADGTRAPLSDGRTIELVCAEFLTDDDES